MDALTLYCLMQVSCIISFVLFIVDLYDLFVLKTDSAVSIITVRCNDYYYNASSLHARYGLGVPGSTIKCIILCGNKKV